jgi:hypothetical protein
MDPALIRPDLVAVAHGRVQDEGGAPLSGVRVAVHGHPEFGWTRTAPDGHFYLVVNDLGALTLDYQRDGLLPAQRGLLLRRQDYNLAHDLQMLPEAPAAGVVDLSAPVPPIVRGPEVADRRGVRRPVLLIEPGTRAHAVLPGGRVPLRTMTFHITEYTRDRWDPARLPGSVPPEIYPLYASEINVAEAEEKKARRVEFEPPLVMYRENILFFLPGHLTSRHSYDTERLGRGAEGAGDPGPRRA